MKNMKRILSLILSGAMCLSVCGTVFAAESAQPTDEQIVQSDCINSSDLVKYPAARKHNYYRDQLATTEEKNMYDNVYKALQNPTISMFTLGTFSTRESLAAPEAPQAYIDKLKLEWTNTINALTNDWPELFYWFDKTVGCDGKYNLTSFTNDWADGGECKVTLFFEVSKNYKGTSAGHFEITDNNGNVVQSIEYFNILAKGTNNIVDKANAYAKTIADEANAKYKTNYEKVKYFNTKICGLTEYNYDAVKNQEAYGDPWQMIYVFDNDPATKVVCEGYAKAFQYLCDLTNIDSLIVTGNITPTGTAAGDGAHMWNQVNLDGEWYLVDITNNDGNIPNEKLLAIGTGSPNYKKLGFKQDNGYNYPPISTKDHYIPKAADPTAEQAKVSVGTTSGVAISVPTQVYDSGAAVTVTVKTNDGYKNAKAYLDSGVRGAAVPSTKDNEQPIKDGQFTFIAIGGVDYLLSGNAEKVETPVDPNPPTPDPDPNPNPNPDPNPNPNPNPGDGGSSGSGGSSSGGGGGSSSSGKLNGVALGGRGSSSNNGSVSASQATTKTADAIKNAVAQAQKNGTKASAATVNFKDVSKLSPEALKAVVSAANKANKGVKVTMTVDTMNGKSVETRMYVDPTKATLKTDLNMTLSLNDKKLSDAVAKTLKGKAVTMSFGQTGSFGMEIEVATKVDLTGMNTANLKFYSFDLKTNTYTLIPISKYFVDSAGYLHFTTTQGGNIVVTDANMAKK